MPSRSRTLRLARRPAALALATLLIALAGCGSGGGQRGLVHDPADIVRGLYRWREAPDGPPIKATILFSGPMHAAYGAAKAGLMAWIQSLAEELGPHDIRANAVAPGTILSPRMDAVFTDEQRRVNAANSPLGRMGATSDIASACLFLTSDLSSYISGRTIVVDGGVDAKFPYPTTL